MRARILTIATLLALGLIAQGGQGTATPTPAVCRVEEDGSSSCAVGTAPYRVWLDASGQVTGCEWETTGAWKCAESYWHEHDRTTRAHQHPELG